MKLLLGDALDVLKTLPGESVDSCVTDPPYGLKFMGKKWDYAVPSVDVWREVLRVLKPGGHLLAFAGTRTQHRMAVNIEDAGFEIRDMIAWVYGSGFPKSLDVSKAIDKAAGAEREVVGTQRRSQVASEGWDRPWKHEAMQASGSTVAEFNITAPATEAAKKWAGYGTALKPSHEPVGVYYKPLTIKNIIAILLADVTEQNWRLLCQWSDVSARDAESLLNGIHATLEKAGAFSVVESAKIYALEKTESAILAAWSSMLHGQAENERDTIKAGSVLVSARANGSAQDTQESRIQVGQADGISMVDTFMSAIMEDTSENIALLWSNTLAALLIQASTFTIETAIRLTIALRTLKSFLQANTLQDIGSSKALRPALEPITVARKPLGGTVVENVLKWGCGGLNIDASRVGTEEITITGTGGGKYYDGKKSCFPVGDGIERKRTGRFPANLIHDGSDEVVGLFPVTKNGGQNETSTPKPGMFGVGGNDGPTRFAGDSGSAARFFYCAKASKADRDEGCEGLEAIHRANGNKWTDQDYRVSNGERPPSAESGPRRNFHPTVKPTALMRYLCRLVTPPNGIVLDPFMGSGSTGKAAVLEGFDFIGIELNPEYMKIAERRIFEVAPLFQETESWLK